MSTEKLISKSKPFSTFTRKNLNLLFAAGFAFCSSGANAATLFGATVDYTFDDSFLNSLFGSYSVNGDTLSFSPTNFAAQVSDPGIDITNATTPSIRVSAKSGYTLTGLSLLEQGDYFRIETAPGTTFAGVSGQFIVNDNPSNFSSLQPLTAVFSFTALALGTPFVTTPWTVAENVALNAAESATFKVQNVLVGGVLTAGAAFVEKKLVSIGAATVPVAVPAPAAFWTFGSVLLGMLFAGRRKLFAG